MTAHTKPVAELSAAQLRARTTTLCLQMRDICDELIAARRGSERGTDIRAKTDPLSARYVQVADAQFAAADEWQRRVAWGGSLSPIPRES